MRTLNKVSNEDGHSSLQALSLPVTRRLCRSPLSIRLQVSEALVGSSGEPLLTQWSSSEFLINDDDMKGRRHTSKYLDSL